MKNLNNLTEDSFVAALNDLKNGKPKALVHIIKGLSADAWEHGLRRNPTNLSHALIEAAVLKIESNRLRADSREWRKSHRHLFSESAES